VHFAYPPLREDEKRLGSIGGKWFMTTNNARSAFLRSYHLPAILLHYPRLVRAMQGIAILNGMEAAHAFATSRLAGAGAVKPSIVTEELIELRLRHGNIAEQHASSQEALGEMECGLFATEGREGCQLDR
jgi:hypothetical protein